MPSSTPVRVGETVGLAFRSDNLVLFDARTGSAIQTANQIQSRGRNGHG
jgi:multiple sugar transport system ATP-binding protein